MESQNPKAALTAALTASLEATLAAQRQVHEALAVVEQLPDARVASDLQSHLQFAIHTLAFAAGYLQAMTEVSDAL